MLFSMYKQFMSFKPSINQLKITKVLIWVGPLWTLKIFSKYKFELVSPSHWNFVIYFNINLIKYKLKLCCSEIVA